MIDWTVSADVSVTGLSGKHNPLRLDGAFF